MKNWFVVRSNSLKELFLCEQFYLRGIEAYCPSIRTHPVNPRARKIRAYFPGYLFVHADLREVDVSSLRWLPGVVGLVSFGDELAAVPDDMVMTIKKKVDLINEQGGKVAVGLKQGEQVTIRNGPFDGCEAIFDSRLSEHGRVRVFIELLQNRQVRLELPAAQVERVNRFQL